MPKSIENSSDFDFSNDLPLSQHQLQQQQPLQTLQHQQQTTVPAPASANSQSSASSATPKAGPSATAAAAAAAASKKFRHQNYSKNIYIGTKNAERWETTKRASLSFKNDVEFVSYLLKLAEIDLADSNGYVRGWWPTVFYYQYLISGCIPERALQVSRSWTIKSRRTLIPIRMRSKRHRLRALSSQSR